MIDPKELKVGNKITNNLSDSDFFVEIKSIGKTSVYAQSFVGAETIVFFDDSHWEKWECFIKNGEAPKKWPEDDIININLTKEEFGKLLSKMKLKQNQIIECLSYIMEKIK
jgi:hypothetical protein